MISDKNRKEAYILQIEKVVKNSINLTIKENVDNSGMVKCSSRK
jgi:hypothetical protein